MAGPALPPQLRPINLTIRGRVAGSGVDFAPDEVPGGTLDILEVRGESMAPMAPSGAWIIPKPRDSFRSGDVAVVCVDGQVLLKYVIVKGERITLACENKDFKPRTYAASKVEILVVVDEIRLPAFPPRRKR